MRGLATRFTFPGAAHHPGSPVLRQEQRRGVDVSSGPTLEARERNRGDQPKRVRTKPLLRNLANATTARFRDPRQIGAVWRVDHAGNGVGWCASWCCTSKRTCGSRANGSSVRSDPPYRSPHTLELGTCSSAHHCELYDSLDRASTTSGGQLLLLEREWTVNFAVELFGAVPGVPSRLKRAVGAAKSLAHLLLSSTSIRSKAPRLQQQFSPASRLSQSFHLIFDPGSSSCDWIPASQASAHTRSVVPCFRPFPCQWQRVKILRPCSW